MEKVIDKKYLENAFNLETMFQSSTNNSSDHSLIFSNLKKKILSYDGSVQKESLIFDMFKFLQSEYSRMNSKAN